MDAQIFNFAKYKYIKLSAICHTCGASWTAEVMKGTYKEYVQNRKKYICPFCQHSDTGLAVKANQS